MRRIGGVIWKRSSLLLVALCVCVGLAALAVQAMGSFGKPKGFAVGASPSAIALGDLNGDGRRDIAVANYRSDNVSILLGKGGGSFGKKRNFSVGSRPWSLAIGKLNGDATPDIAVADGTGVSVLLGKGDGTFAPAKDYPAGKYPSSVAIGDFDGNGSRDLAVVVSTGVSILLGRGDGTFGPAQLYPTGINPVTVVVGNFDADANLDLAVSNAGAVDCEGRVGHRAQASSCTGGFGTVSVLRGRGDGSFGPTTEFPVGRETAPTAMVVGDFNADRKPDLALVDSMQYSLGGSILLGNGAGGFGKASSFTAGHEPVALAVGDFNQDSRQDLAVISREDPKGLLILRGRGDGSFGPPAEVSTGLGSRGAASAVAVGNLNAGLNPDLVVAVGTWPQAGDRVVVLLNASQSRRSLTLAYSRSRRRFTGRLSSVDPACVRAQRVRVLRRRRGRDLEVGAAITAKSGAYSIGKKAGRGAYYARVRPWSACRAAISKVVSIR